jgi:glycosyltransferase involved in cell wall biosynthesis
VDKVHPNPHATGTLPDGVNLRVGDEIVTYIARNLEPYRGFPTFMRAAKLILERRPNAQILVIGGDGVSYGSKRSDGKTYREHYLEELDLDLTRIHFLGRVPYSRYLQVLQLSAVHVYLTYPFVLSWSCLEAMAAGCLVVGSRTPPVEEVIRDGHNGLLVDFFSPEEIADRVDQVLDHPDRMQRLREAARETVVHRYALKSCLARQARLIEEIAKKGKTRLATRAAAKGGRQRSTSSAHGKRAATARR